MTISRRGLLLGTGAALAGGALTRASLAPAATAPSGTSIPSGTGTAKSAGRVTPKAAPSSRQWMERAMDIVRADKPTPPGAARLYACCADAYERALTAGASTTEAGETFRQMLVTLAPARASDLRAARPVHLPSKVRAVIDQARRSANSDGWQADAPARDMERAPSGVGKWVRVGGLGPFAPTAGSWRRFVVTPGGVGVPAPITPSDARYEEQKRAVVEAVARRDADWVAKINFWGGVPGTEGPAGIWLNRLWMVVGASALGASDRQYARVQSILSKTLADAFMECWSVKYTYWTERPDMAIPGLVVAMPNPPFPAYVSGHSTISAAAATVLGGLVPEHRELWLRDAETARDSRLYAGIHFPQDNDEGFALGVGVGRAVLNAYKLRG